MSGWVPMPAETWPTVVEVLERSGCPWPEEAAAFDLRWHFDRDGEVPSRRVCMARWRWPERRTRTLLRTMDRWWDPMRGVPETSQRRPKGVPETSQKGPNPDRSNLDNQGEMPQRRPRDVPKGSQRRPRDVHTRVDPPSHSPTPTPAHPPNPPAGGRAPGRLVEDPQRLRQAIADPHASELADVLEHCQRDLGGFGLSPSDVQAIRGALKAGHTVEELILVWEHFQRDAQTAWARDKGLAHRWDYLASSKKLAAHLRDARLVERRQPRSRAPPAAEPEPVVDGPVRPSPYSLPETPS